MDDVLHFSPKYKFSDLVWENKHGLIDAFKDRVEGFYMHPAQKLNMDKDGFAVGLLCVATIDCLARISSETEKDVGGRFVLWLSVNIDEFKDSDLATRFYKEFRCGLVHEGRIKNAGEFSYEYPKMVSPFNGSIMVNPDKLLRAVEGSFQSYLQRLRNLRIVPIQPSNPR